MEKNYKFNYVDLWRYSIAVLKNLNTITDKEDKKMSLFSCIGAILFLIGIAIIPIGTIITMASLFLIESLVPFMLLVPLTGLILFAISILSFIRVLIIYEKMKQ